jgi:hypothetical protein
VLLADPVKRGQPLRGRRGPYASQNAGPIVWKNRLSGTPFLSSGTAVLSTGQSSLRLAGSALLWRSSHQVKFGELREWHSNWFELAPRRARPTPLGAGRLVGPDPARAPALRMDADQGAEISSGTERRTAGGLIYR